MGINYVFRASCRQDFPVRPKEDEKGNYVLLAGCADCKVPAGATLAFLMETCLTCPKRKGDGEGEVKRCVIVGEEKEQIMATSDANPGPRETKGPLPQPTLPTVTVPLPGTGLSAAPAAQESTPTPKTAQEGTDSPPPASSQEPAAPASVAQEPMPSQDKLQEEQMAVSQQPEQPEQPEQPAAQAPSQPVQIGEPGPPGPAPLAPAVEGAPGTFQLPVTTVPEVTTVPPPPGAQGPTEAPPPAPMAPPQAVNPAMPAQPAPTQPAPAQPAPSLGTAGSAAAGGNLLSDLLGGKGGEELVDVNEVLDGIEGIQGGPSEGGFSWHTLEVCMQCWRKAYFAFVLGLVKKVQSRALQYGSLYHAFWELWYRFGGTKPYDLVFDAVRRAGAPQLAGECQRLVYIELQKYAAQEASEWDIRAVEQNAVFFAEPQRIDGKTVHLPFSCRHDALIAKRQLGAPCSPLGPVQSGIYVVDRKTTSALTYDLTKGYAMDGQFQMNALVFKRSGEEQEFGPLKGMIFSVAAKHKDPSPEKSFHRVETVAEDGMLAEFYHAELLPYATELYRRLASSECRKDPKLWPKNHSQCVGRYGCCDYFDLCDVGGESLIELAFKSDPRRIIDLERLAEPSAEVKRAAKAEDPKKAASETRRKQRTDYRKRLGELVLEAFREAASSMPLFNSQNYLVPGHTEKSVREKLIDTLRESWELGLKFPFGPDAEGNTYQMEVKEKGIAWCNEVPPSQEELASAAAKNKKLPKPQGFKGTMSFAAIATALCKDWWDMSKNPPQAK